MQNDMIMTHQRCSELHEFFNLKVQSVALHSWNS